MIEFTPIPPALLTPEEAARYLRLDEGRAVEHGVRALERYVGKGLLHATKIGKQNRFSLAELQRFIEARTGVADD